MRRYHGPAVVVAGVMVAMWSLGACTSSEAGTGTPKERDSSTAETLDSGETKKPVDATASTEPLDSGRSDLSALRAPMRVDGIRWARGNVPRSVPEPGDSLPSLLDDPPGRALVASYAPRPSENIAGEAIEFYGVDGRWRRLDLGDLDLRNDRFSGGDTYGAGALSPDGRWWAGPTIDGMFLVDLRDGTTTELRGVLGRAGMASFKWSPDSDELVLVLVARSIRVSVPGLELTPFPRPENNPTLLADGGWVECLVARQVTTQCSTYAADGAVVEERPVPDDLQQKFAYPVGAPEVEAGTLFYNLPASGAGNARHPSDTLRTDLDYQANAVLRLPAGSEITYGRDVFDADTLGLVAYDDWLLLAWLVDDEAIVKLTEPGVGLGGTGQDFWDISYARDLIRIR